MTDIDGKNVTWHYKTVGEYENEQLRVYTPDMTGEECVYANVYLWDNKWGDVEWWEDGVKKGNMVKADGTDPMITGVIKNKVDSIWKYFWTGGITNPMTVMEQMTYLMFILSRPVIG